MKAYFHGEVVATKIEKLPKGLNLVKPRDGRYIVADSETTGNHHCIEDVEGAEMYEKDGVLYLKNDVPVKMFCVDEKRHDTEVLEPGVWEIDRANEHDYLKDMKRKVAD